MDNNVQDYALLHFAQINLLLPQHEVLSIEVTKALDVTQEIPGSVGLVSTADHSWPVFALSSEFNLHNSLPGNYRYCLGIRSEKMIYALACETVMSHQVDDSAMISEIADCMKLPETPFQGLLIHDDQLAMVCSANGLADYLENRVSSV